MASLWDDCNAYIVVLGYPSIDIVEDIRFSRTIHRFKFVVPLITFIPCGVPLFYGKSVDPPLSDALGS